MTAPNTTNNVTVRKLANVAEGMWNKSKNAFVNASGDTMTGRLTMENVPINQIVTGTGTAATSSSSGGTTTYYPAKWNFDLGIATPSAGDQLVIKIPVAGHDYGTFMSTDNGTTYYPVAQSTGATRFTTRYPVNAYVFIVFEEYTGSSNSGQVNDCFALTGSTGRKSYTIGCWRVVNDYDSGNNYDRLYTANGRFRTGTTGCYPYSLVCLDNTQSYSTLVTNNPGTGTNKAVNTDGKFVFPASILYYAGNNTTAAGALVSSTYSTYLAYPTVNVQYSSNHTTTFTTNKPVYIECTLNGDGTWSPTSNSITQTLRTSYYYIYLGIAYSTEYQVSLAPEHPLYYYDGTNLVSAEVARGDITAGTNNGELKVAGTDITVYTHPTDAGNKHIPAGGSSGQFLGYDSDGTARWVSNPNTDTKVKATAKTDNANYKILATASASPTSGAATEAVYDTDITLNPSTNTISANVSGTAASAGKLTTARTTYVTLGTASTSTTRDWSGTTTIPVSGTLGLGNGGTGATSAAGARTNLDVYSKSETESLLNGKVVVVTQLPATGESGVTYYVKDTSSSAVDKYDEYIWAKDAGASTESWIHVGEKSIDLSNYVNALSTSGSGPLVASLSKSGNTLTATMGTISIDDLSDWATDTDVTVSSVTYHTWWPVAPTSSNQVYGLSIYNGRLYRIYNNKGTYSAQAYDTNTTYTNKSLGQGYGTCATEAATAAKIVSMSDYALTTGGIVTVKFTNALCASATMNINGKGAKPIYIKGAAVTANNAATVSAGDTAYFMYDGTAYHLLGTDRAATNPIVNISRSGTTFTATRLDGTTFTFTQQDNNTTYTQAKLGQGYGTCTTAEATAAKSVTLTGYELEPNGVVAVKFTNGLCASATMSINSKTATPIYINGAAVTSTSCKEVLAGDLAFFIYDGSHYQFICTDRISKNGITGLSISGRTITYTRADGSTGTLTTQDTTYTFDGVYNSSSNKAATVSTVTNAVNALDVDDITGFGAGKTLATLTETDGKIAATFQNISITKSQVSDFSHAHGNITNDGKIGTTANLPVITGTSGSVTTGSFATSTVAVDTSSSAGTANTFSRGDHKHSISLATGDAPGQVKIAGTNVTVQGWDNKQSYYDATFTRSYRNVSNCWAKLASMSLDLSANSEVSGAWEIFASGQWAQVGIVNFHTKITANETTSSYSENLLYWIGDTAAINSGYNFCMVLKPKAASGQPVVMELWGLCTTRYQGIGIREIGGTGTSAERDPAHTWVYYNPTDSDIGAKPSATEGTVIVDPVPHTQTKSVLKNFTIPAGQVSYVKIMTPTGQHQKMVVYSADGTNLHGECILRTYNDGNPSSGRCQVLALGGNPRRWFGKANEQYIEFDWTAESADRAFRFGITELSGGNSVNFELVDTLPSGTTEITPTGMTPASHSHGNITNNGTLQTNDVNIESGDKLVITDASDSNKVTRSSTAFDGTTTTKALTQKGTFESFAKASDITSAVQALEVSSVGGDGKYISAISETDGKISATATTMDTTPTANSTNAVTSGGVKTDLDNRIDRYDAVYNRNNVAGDGWVKLADVTFSRTTQVDKPFVWDVVISRCTSNTSTEQLTLNVRYNASGLPVVYFKRYYKVDRTSTHKFAVVTYERGGVASGNGKVELWAYLEKHWGSIGIREIAGSQSTALYDQKKVVANYYSYTSEGGTTKPVADLENYVQVIDSTNIQLASSSDVSTAITTAINALDVASAGGDGKYIKAISETDGKISATVETMDTTPTASSTKAVTSGGVKTALDGKAASSHSHGNIQNGGTLQTTDVAIANGDKLVITDSSDSNKVARASVAFDGSTSTKALTQKGTFETFTKVESSSSNGNIKIDGTDTTVYTHPPHTAYSSKGSATKVPQITTDALGHVTSISEVTISGVTPASHSHGNIQNGGTLQTTDVAIANGDKLVVTDASDSNKVARTSVSFDGSTTTKALTQKGTFESFAKSGDITTAIQALAVPSVGGAGKYISEISETGGTISATATTMDTTPTASSTNAVTSGGVKTALDSKVSSIKMNGSTITPSSGVANIGHIPTTYPVATGTAQEVIQLLRVRPGGSIGSVNLKASTISSTTIAAGWYNYMWIPHRTGAATDDSQNFGSLFLTPLTSTPNLYIVEGQSLHTESPIYRIRQFANATHTHGNIQNDGTLQTDDVTIANGDKLVITDASDSDKVARASIAFDGATTTKVLTQKGTFEEVSAIDFDRYYLESTTQDDYKANLRYLQHIDVKTDAYLSCIKLYDITEFYNGTINNSGSDHSLFDGTIIKTRTEGSAASDIAHITAHVGYNGAAILKSDNANLRPVVIKELFDVNSNNGMSESYAMIFEEGAQVDIDTTATVMGAGINLQAGESCYINAYAPNNLKAWGFVSSSFTCIQTSTGSRYNGVFTATESGTIIWQHTVESYSSYEYTCGKLTNTPRYYLAVLHSGSNLGGWFSFTGRWHTRYADSTGSTVIHARPLLMKAVHNDGGSTYALPSGGYQIYADTTYYVSAEKLGTARNLSVSLSNTSTTTTFDGSADVTNIKVTGTLPVANGGTGKTTVTAAEYNLLSKMGTELTGEMNNDRLFAFAYSTQNETNGRLAGYRKASTVWSWIKGKLTSDTNVDISGHADSATYDGNGNTISDNSVYYVVGTTDYPAWQANHVYALNDYAISGGKAYYCKTAHTSGTSFDSSKWTAVATPVIKGTVSNVATLFAGMKIALKWPITGGSSSTYLNINNLGNVYIRRNDSNTTTHVPANTVTFLTYDGTYWRWSDYDSNATYSGMVTAYLNNAGDAAKSATSFNFKLTDGITIILTNNAANTKAAALTLNVNSTGAKSLYINGNISSSTNYTIPVGTYFCHYKVVNGTGQWHLWTDGTAHFTKLHLDTPLPDAEIASAATWNAKQDTITYMTLAQENELISELGEL